MTHPDEPLWRELEAKAAEYAALAKILGDDIYQDFSAFKCVCHADKLHREATHALRREAPWQVAWCIGHRCDDAAVAIVEWPYIEQREQVLDQIWRLRDREQDERQRQREAAP